MKHFYSIIITALFSCTAYSQVTELYISKYGEGSSNHKFLEIYNGTNADIDLSNYSISSCSNGCDAPGGFDYPDNITFAPGTIIQSGDVYVITDEDADPSIHSDQTFTYLSNGDDFMALTLAGATESEFTIIDARGDMGPDPGNGWEVAGISNGTLNHTLTRKPTVCGPNPTPLASFGTNSEDSEWIVGESNSGWDTVGSYDGCVSGPILTITSPSNNQDFDSGTTSVIVSVSVANFNIGELNSGADGHIHWTINNQQQPMKYDTLDETINVADGESYSVYMELVDDSHQAINPAVNQTVSFEVNFPCDLYIDTINSSCDSNTAENSDTYSTSLSFTGGGTTSYVIDTGGVGTIEGDDPSVTPEGVIIISGVPENTDYVVSFTGDPSNSSCDFIRSISSPNCNPSIALPYNDPFDYPDGSLTSYPNWNNFSGNEGDLLVTNGQAIVQHGTPSEDAGVSFDPVEGVIYYAFDFSVNNPGNPISGSDFEYFALFKDDGFNYRARIDIVSANDAASDFTVGISTKNSTADVIWPGDLDFETTYRATVKYDQAQNTTQLWINADAETDPSIYGNDEDDPGTTITQFGLRQSDSSANEGILIDNLSITQTFNETLNNNEFSDLDYSFILFPNPSVSGIISIKSNRQGEIKSQVFDLLGKELINTKIKNQKLDLSSLSSGIYIIRLTQGNLIWSKKFIKQ